MNNAHPRAFRRLPGDLDKKTDIERMIRVDQAGEFGAQRIYEGQIAVLGDTKDGPILREMKAQEDAHLAFFERVMIEREVRPTALAPLWRIGGYALGAGTALMGREAAMACTVAVEEAIEDHYAKQLERLDDDDPKDKELKKAITRFRQEEMEHRDIGLANDAEQAAGYKLLSRAIKTGCKAAIWLSERL